jgi:hypothetical protein
MSEPTLFRLSPTDISQFVRLEQCERYLRLRLREREEGRDFLRDYGVQPQSIPPLLTRSGRAFEERIEEAVRARYPTANLAQEAADPWERGDDNARVLAEAAALAPGSVRVLFQARLRAALAGWQLTGDADVLRLARTEAGVLHLLIADLKSSAATRVEHRLQVAFYHAMLDELFRQQGGPAPELATAILYRGAERGQGDPPPEEAEAREQAERWFGVEACLETVRDARAYLDVVADLVTGSDSLARRVREAPFDRLPFHLTYKCDGCLYNEFCMKWAAEHDDLSLIPHLSVGDKGALQRLGLNTTRELALLKEFPAETPGAPRPDSRELLPAPGREELCRRAAVTWPVGPRLDELIHRARRYRKWKRDPIEALYNIPSKGYGSLPYCDAAQNPNLVRVYIDAQHDYLHDRIYLLGALVVACEAGVPARRRAVVHLTEGSPASPEQERELLARWMRETLRAIVELAAPDPSGARAAPLHLIFFNSFEQRLLLDGLSRHLPALLGTAPALYDLMTQLAAFDSPIASFLDQEIRELKNYPMVCQSLQAVAARLRFQWDEPERYTRLFRERLFDYWGNLRPGEEPEWYAARARFSSQIPLEYAYAAWGELAPPEQGRDELAPYRATTPELLLRFQQRRLDALEHVAADFPGNRLTAKKPFDLPELDRFDDRARSLAQALDEFVTIERHVELHAWKSIRHAPPERRVLMGEALLGAYREEDQQPEAAERNREHRRLQALRERYRAELPAVTPDAPQPALSSEQQREVKWSQVGLHVRLRLTTEGADCTLEEALVLTTLKPGDRVVVCPRWTVDERLPAAEQQPFTPTPRQMLYGTRATLLRLEQVRDEDGAPREAWAELELVRSPSAHSPEGFLFAAIERPLEPGALYSLDPDPNDIYGFWCAKITQGLVKLERGETPGRSPLYERLAGGAVTVGEPMGELPVTGEGQQRFRAGLEALAAAGILHSFEESKLAYIGEHGAAPLLLVQGPPGTGKSYSTGFALLARLQEAMAAGREGRILVSCKTHAATDVLIASVLAARERLRAIAEAHPETFAAYFDPRLLEVPLYRIAGKGVQPEGIDSLCRDDDRPKGTPKNLRVLQGRRWWVAAATPGGIYGMLKTEKQLFDRPICDCLVLDEASQMNLPEALMAALPLRPEGQVIVVGDHRQMPPIVTHDWDREPRRTFQECRAYESLFLFLAALDPPTIRFAESFRLHAEMAEFLRREVYQQDGIPYFSRRRAELPRPEPTCDPFLEAVLSSRHPLTVVVHGEGQSQTRNAFEKALIRPILDRLADPAAYALDAEEGLGVVVPHRAQRAALQLSVPALNRVDPETGVVLRSAVDTVERFQGGEREVILISATESDREYLLASAAFLLDPRRLTVALSRAKRKLVLVASRSIFSLFSPDEEAFSHSQLWKNLLRHTCTELLWEGEREGHPVQVWGSGPTE